MILPNGWTIKPAKEICEKIQDGTHFSPKNQFSNGPFPYVTAKNVRPWGLDLNNLTYLEEEEHRPIYERSDTRKGDVLLVKDGVNAGDTAINTIQGEISLLSSVCFLRPKKILRSKFLRYYLQSPQCQAELLGNLSGSAIRRIILRKIRLLPIIVAPLEEQDAIIKGLDTQLSRLDEAVTTLQGIQAKLKQARASILKAAVEGRLVETEAELAAKEHREFQCATERLIDLHLQRKERRSERRTRRPQHATNTTSQQQGEQLPPGWHLATVEQLIDDIQAGKSFTALNTPPGISATGIAKISAVTWGLYNEGESKTVTNPARINEDYIIQEGDLLMSRANTVELVGAVVIARNVQRRVMLSDKILRLHAPSEIKEWLLWTLRCPHGREQIESLCTGNQESMRNIGQDRIRSIKVPLPPFGEQLRITNEVNRCFSILDQVEATVQTSLVRCGKLRQAILKQAFEGRLVPAA